MTIQACKLLTDSKSQKFNLHKLLRRLQSESLDDDLTNLIAENSKKPFVKVFRTISEFEEQVNAFQKRFKEYESLIQKLKTSRDTLYAHRDRDGIPQNITLDDVRSLQNFCIEVHNKIRGGFYDESVFYHYTADWNIDFVLKQCSIGRSSRKM